MLFAAGHAELETESGQALPVELRSVEGEAVIASAPRLRVAEGRTLLGRIVGEDGSPYVVTLRVTAAGYETVELASIRLEPVGVADDPSRRRTLRVPVGGLAQLEAVSCQNVVDGDRVEGTLVDLSCSGVAFATTRVLARGDRLRFRGRFFADTVTGEVRVASLRPSPLPGRTIAGCLFIDPGAELLAAVERVLTPVGPQPSGGGEWLHSLREASGGESAEGRRLFWRRRPRSS
jgi:hypothetical protein